MKFYALFGRIVFWSAGFWITVKGKQASREDAAILVGAPHSTFLVYSWHYFFLTKYISFLINFYQFIDDRVLLHK